MGLRPPRGLDCLRHCAYKFPFKKNIRNKMLSMKNILPCCPRGIRKFAIPELSDFRKGITCSNNQKITDLFWKKIVGFSPKLCLYFMIVWPFFILHFSDSQCYAVCHSQNSLPFWIQSSMEAGNK